MEFVAVNADLGTEASDSVFFFSFPSYSDHAAERSRRFSEITSSTGDILRDDFDSINELISGVNLVTYISNTDPIRRDIGRL